MRPPPEPGRDFQNRTHRQTVANSRKNCAGPLCSRATPRSRPFLARFFPVVLHGIDRIIANTAFIKNLAGTGIEMKSDMSESFPFTSLRYQWQIAVAGQQQSCVVFF